MCRTLCVCMCVYLCVCMLCVFAVCMVCCCTHVVVLLRVKFNMCPYEYDVHIILSYDNMYKCVSLKYDITTAPTCICVCGQYTCVLVYVYMWAVHMWAAQFTCIPNPCMCTACTRMTTKRGYTPKHFVATVTRDIQAIFAQSTLHKLLCINCTNTRAQLWVEASHAYM